MICFLGDRGPCPWAGLVVELDELIALFVGKTLFVVWHYYYLLIYYCFYWSCTTYFILICISWISPSLISYILIRQILFIQYHHQCKTSYFPNTMSFLTYLCPSSMLSSKTEFILLPLFLSSFHLRPSALFLNTTVLALNYTKCL